jgi:hypothetical protein
VVQAEVDGMLRLWLFLLVMAPVGCIVGVLLHAFGHRRARRVDKTALVMAAGALVFPFVLLLLRPSMFFSGRISAAESRLGEGFNLGPFIVAVVVAVPTLIVSAFALHNSSRPPFE